MIREIETIEAELAEARRVCRRLNHERKVSKTAAEWNRITAEITGGPWQHMRSLEAELRRAKRTALRRSRESPRSSDRAGSTRRRRCL